MTMRKNIGLLLTFLFVPPGWEFRYIDGNRILALHDGEFFTFPEAYEKGYLSDMDISVIHEKFRDVHEGKYIQEIL